MVAPKEPLKQHKLNSNSNSMKKFISAMAAGYVHVFITVLAAAGTIFLMSCNEQKPKKAEKNLPESDVVHPKWSKNANIYEVNVRQFTPEGTFAAFEDHMPRLKEMGVDILWLMPIHPVGEKNRKGELGSYYSVKDYKGVNPEFGTLDDLKSLVKKAHEMGMYVIIDWVANHTAWDHQWMEDHPEWYTIDSNGNFVAPFDWTDVADLNFENKELWAAMTDALKYWVTEADIDGYRCDVAAMVPVEFWNQARVELDKIKPVFMLAEAEEPGLHTHAFDMTYAWELHHIMNSIAKGEMDANALQKYFQKADTLYPKNAYRMAFTSNHDENSWNGTEFERMGDGHKVFAVLSATLPGMPLIYSGQEAALDKRLAFFSKDTIDWKDYPYEDFYKSILQLKKEQKPLWNGNFGSKQQRIKTTKNKLVYAFMRVKKEEKVIVLTNLSDKELEIELMGSGYEGTYKSYFDGHEVILKGKDKFTLGPWGYRVFVY